MGYAGLLFLGVVLIVAGVININGDISTIHWYNRLRVSEADAPKYGKAMGIGTLIAGASIALTAVLQLLFEHEIFYYIIVLGAVAGVAVILHAQFKYNKGIF